MFLLIMTFIFLLAACVAPFFIPNKFGKIGAAIGFAALSLCTLTLTSVVDIDKNKIGLLYRSYFAESLPAGRIMMVDEKGTTYKGPQPNYLTEGTYFIPFVKVLFDIKETDIIEVPVGKYMKLVARDGRDLPSGEFMAPEWVGSKEDFLDPKSFLLNGGFKGPQLTVLPPGKYAVNTYFWNVSFGNITEIQTGEVGVVRSNVSTGGVDCPVVKQEGTASIQATLVPRGCKGIWSESIEAGKYYLHEDAYRVTIQSTRAASWVYAGGYTRRSINLTVSENGSIDQEPSSTKVPYDSAKHAGQAVLTRTLDGQEVPVEVRLQAQVQAANASRVVAGVGEMSAVEDRVVAPIVNDIVRQIASNNKAIDLASKRNELVESIEKAVVPEAAKAGVTITEVRIDDIVLPPEVTLPSRRSELAMSLKATYEQEKLAAAERALAENAIAVANQQSTIVAAQMKKEADKLYGEGERDRLIEIAKGQKAQMEVIGKEKTVELQMFERLMQVAEKNPAVIKVPVIQVSGNGSTLEGAAAILGGSSNLSQFLQAK